MRQADVYKRQPAGWIQPLETSPSGYLISVQVAVSYTHLLIGVYSSMTLDQLTPFKTKGYAVIVAALAMFIIQSYNKKANKQWLKEWGLTICMVVGMLASTVIGAMGG